MVLGLRVLERVLSAHFTGTEIESFEAGMLYPSHQKQVMNITIHIGKISLGNS